MLKHFTGHPSSGKKRQNDAAEEIEEIISQEISQEVSDGSQEMAENE
jgi:hypothetical protein